ncbi:cytochrome b [Chelatococcus sp. GCM10030263]|uniref:cytochrome b n=1 Tax=Chelatococcus sp. GCM10030263 TaxID=3273387 RepID=UPI00360A5B87
MSKAGNAAATGDAAPGVDVGRYDKATIALHWLTAILVIAQFGLAELWGLPPRPIGSLMIGTHMSLGVLLTLVVALRIGWRLIRGHRSHHASVGWAERGAQGVHYLLYALLATEAVLGFVLRWSGNEAMTFFGLLIPPPFAPFSRPAHHLVGEAHNVLAWMIIVVATAHALAALFHHYVLRDDILQSMLPGRK